MKLVIAEKPSVGAAIAAVTQVRSVAAGRRPGEESPGNAERHAG